MDWIDGRDRWTNGRQDGWMEKIISSRRPLLYVIMDGFFHAYGLPNVYGAIDGSRIPHSQKPINRLLQYLQIIIVEKIVVIQLLCMQFVTWTNWFGMLVV
jgi:hypothetical protein